MSDIITVQELCLWYGSHQALRNINMGIPEKSITALIGPFRLRKIYSAENAEPYERPGA